MAGRIMSDLMKGWEVVPLKEIAIFIKGKKPKTLSDVRTNGTVPYIDIKAFEKGEIRQYADIDSSNIACREDVLVVWDGARSGLVGIGQEGAIGSTILAIKPFCISPHYLYQFLQTKYEYINTNHRGTGIPHVDPEVFWNIEFPIAPLLEQRRIVAKLEKLLHRVDACKERLDKIPAVLKRFRQSILSAACSGQLTADWRTQNPNVEPASNLIKKAHFQIAVPEDGLPNLPQMWEWVALGNYGQCFRGRFSVRPRNDPNYFDGQYPFIQIGNLPPEGGWITSHTQTLNERGLAVSKKFPKGTIVIAIVGATIGNTGLLAYDMCFTDSMVGIETGTEIGNRYVELFLRHKKHYIRQVAYSSGGQPNIKLEILNPYPLALPPLPEQHEIVRRVEALFKKADEIEVRYKKAKAFVDKLTQSTLAKAFRGELVLQDPNDEPASALIEQIKAEKAKQDQKKQRKGKNESRTSHKTLC